MLNQRLTTSGTSLMIPGWWVARLMLALLLLSPLLAWRAVKASPVAPALDEAELVAAIEQYVEQQVADDQFSGAVLVAKAGEVIFQQAYGLASKAYAVPNQVDTKFNLGSMNKMITAVAIAQLAQAEKLAFDDPISKHLPDYPNAEAAEKVTIHHLLTHTSGLPDYFNDQFMESSRTKFRQIADFFPLFAAQPLQFEPGSQWRYSNSNFLVLGAIVEAVSGQNYFTYVREQIYQPAGMLNTDAYEMDRETPNLAMGYTRASADDEWRNNLFLHVIKGGPAGGGYSTVGDLLRFANALTTHQLLTPEYTEMVLTGKVDVPGPNGEQYAYGFQNEQVNGYRRVGHGGGFQGINGKLDIYPDLDYTVVVLANYDPPAAQLVADRIGKLITGVEIPQAISLTPRELRNYANTYAREGAGGGPSALELVVDRGALWLILGSERHKFLPLSKTEFFDAQFEDIRIHFTLDKQGKATGLALAAGGSPGRYVVAPRAVAFPQPIALSTAQLQRYANTYVRQGPGGGPSQVQLVVEEGALWAVLAEERHRFLPLSASEFFAEQMIDVRLKFSLDDEGQVSGFTLEGAGPEPERFVVEAESAQ
jgi:CubicO group peptidase (beta-lactamase class C family)